MAKSPVEVRAIVAELERLGLIARQAAAPDRVVASPPSLALQPMLLDRERRLTQAHEARVIELSSVSVKSVTCAIGRSPTPIRIQRCHRLSSGRAPGPP